MRNLALSRLNTPAPQASIATHRGASRFARAARVVALTGGLVASLALLPAAHAAVPTTTTVEGALTSAGGGAAADGTYDVVFAIYDGKSAQTAAWSEGPVKVAVKGGRFSYRLGMSKALSSTALAGLKAPWLGIKIGADPELPRRAIDAVGYALVANTVACTGCITASQVANGGISAAKVGFNYAGSATKGGPASDLACTACVSTKEMKFDGDIDLSGNSLKAKNGTFTGDLAAGTVTATGFVGDGSKLTGIKTPSGECKTAGEVVKGINADGSLKCVKAMDPSALPKDGIDEISNGLLNNQFVDVVSADKQSIPIPDNQGSEAVSNLTFPDIGSAQAFEIGVHVENTDLSSVAVTVLPPNDKKVGYTLCDPCGSKDAKILKKSWSPTAKPKSGDLGYWIGKNPKGLWNLKVKDTSFCVVQAPGNAKYCDPNKKTDGWVANWTIKLQTLSSKKVGVKGNLVLASDSAPCDKFAIGAVKYSAALGRVQVCDGSQWWPQLLGTTKATAGLSCKDINQRAPSTKSGMYWVDPDGSKSAAPYQVYCDQETGGGGWTLVAKVKGNDPGMNRLNKAQWYDGKTIGDCTGLKDENALCQSYNTVPFSDVMIRSIFDADRNLAWRHREKFANTRATVREFKRYFTRNRLFGAISNLDYNGNPEYHQDCPATRYGFHGADYTYTYNGYLGVKNGWRSGHAGGVFSASIYNHNHWNKQPNYDYLSLVTMRCVSDFAVGSGYTSMGSTDDKYAINAHWWGNGNSYTNSWKTHAVFVR